MRVVFKCILSRVLHARCVYLAPAMSGATNPWLCNVVRAVCVRACVRACVCVLCFASEGMALAALEQAGVNVSGCLKL